ncbi:DgyrCDS13751 [Dimorphilus gyrociliatus]|uniref:DgyrCDS13751 n=1 Tax=Dimorphilus gyrociliatus TaxID=2664684 RepID=A0A7I8WBN4_9ANNE|nr:DgyrCDS13751 [Dimorphilus gyrociliatus]
MNRKDNEYRQVFEGKALVNQLIYLGQSRFSERKFAIKFAQKLLKDGHLESVVGSTLFEDSLHLYRFKADVVREVRKVKTNYSNRIPKKKLLQIMEIYDQTKSLPNTPAGEEKLESKLSYSQEDIFNTCKYDGVEMPSIDIEDFRTTDLQKLVNDNNGYSDNEKFLLDKLIRINKDHHTILQNYEKQIEDLTERINQLQKELGINNDNNNNIDNNDNNKTASEQKPIPKAPPPPPPAPPLIKESIKPTKQPVKPNLKMRSLYWERIIIDRRNYLNRTFWHEAVEPNFPISDFEQLFGSKNEPKKLIQKKTVKSRQPRIKILSNDKSREIAIKMKTLHANSQDIQEAIYNMDFTKIDMECINDLFRLYLKACEEGDLARISEHLEQNPETPLDEPEIFLLELSKLNDCPDRLNCIMLKKEVGEKIFDIDQQLDSLETAINELKRNDCLGEILQYTLALGNYMNGTTQRGQADGFDLHILTKLTDVKSFDKQTNLLQFICHLICKNEEGTGTSRAIYRLPKHETMQQASKLSPSAIKTELDCLNCKIRQNIIKVREIVENSNRTEPFQTVMEIFFDNAQNMIEHQMERVGQVSEAYQQYLIYLGAENSERYSTF